MNGEWDIDVPWFEKTEAEYRLFREYAPAVRAAIEALARDPSFLQKMRDFWLDMDAADASEARTIPVPETDDAMLAPWVRLLCLLPFLPPMMEDYRKHGYSEDEIRSVFEAFHVCIGATERRSGAAGLTDLYYSWLTLFIKEFFFHLEDYRFERTVHAGHAVYFRRRGQEGRAPELAVLASGGLWHRDGMTLGSAGFESPEGSFRAELAETPLGWSGNAVENGLVRPEKRTLLKTEWEKLVDRGDPVLKLHINTNADLSARHVSGIVRRAEALAKERFGNVNGTTCKSWLLDPAYRKLLGGRSRIADFGEQFIRIAHKSDGREVLEVICREIPADLHDLPEHTRLDRAVKELYLSGGCTHSFEGLYAPEQAHAPPAD